MVENVKVIQQFGVTIFIPKKGNVLDIFAFESALENAMVLHARNTKQEIFKIEVTAVITDEQPARRAVIDALIAAVPGPLQDVAKALNKLNNTIIRVSKKYDTVSKEST